MEDQILYLFILRNGFLIFVLVPSLPDPAYSGPESTSLTKITSRVWKLYVSDVDSSDDNTKQYHVNKIHITTTTMSSQKNTLAVAWSIRRFMRARNASCTLPSLVPISSALSKLATRRQFAYRTNIMRKVKKSRPNKVCHCAVS